MILVFPGQTSAGFFPTQFLSSKQPRCKRFKYHLVVKALRRGDDPQSFQSDFYSDLVEPASSSLDFDDELDRPSGRLDTSSGRRLGYIARKDVYARRKNDFSYDKDDDKFWARQRELKPPSILTGANKYILGGIFVLGIGAGIAADTVLNVEPNNVASREVIDRQTPNSDICLANGMSALVLDQRLYISFNPFNVYVSQAEVKPGCVLLQSNWSVLESRGLVSSNEVRDCKRNMNTFGFVGDLRQAPEVNCVYHSESAENQFLKDPAKAALGDGFQPKTFEE